MLTVLRYFLVGIMTFAVLCAINPFLILPLEPVLLFAVSFCGTAYLAYVKTVDKKYKNDAKKL